MDNPENDKEIITCPKCKGKCTAPKWRPGIGGCNTCMGDGVIEVKKQPKQLSLFKK